MRLLIITQKIDKIDPILGFFHNWIYKLSSKFEYIYVICLEKGKVDLPQNVTINSLGKELEFSIFNFQFSILKKIKYVFKFFHLSFFQSLNYDTVFVHMNQEYVLLGGFFWKIMSKKVYMWRNHAHGNLFTRIAVWLSDKVFCTSKHAFVAKYKKTKIMPVGINTEVFKSEIRNPKSETKNKILFLSRMSPIKKPDLLVESLGLLHKRGANFACDFYGDPLPKDRIYYDSLKNKAKELGLENKVNFYKAVTNYQTPQIYNEHDIFVNLTPAGSFDKTILEAAACGCVLVITNKSLSGEIDGRMIAEDTADSLAERLNFWLNANEGEKTKVSRELQKYVLENHNLDDLINKLVKELKNGL